MEHVLQEGVVPVAALDLDTDRVDEKKTLRADGAELPRTNRL